MAEPDTIHKATEGVGRIRSLCGGEGYQLAEQWDHVTCDACRGLRFGGWSTAGPMFITVHDGNVSKKRFPDGRPMQVRADSIDSMRGYAEGRVRTVLGIRGSYLHVTETEDQLIAMIGGHIVGGTDASAR
jgi:hypothetical protein